MSAYALQLFPSVSNSTSSKNKKVVLHSNGKCGHAPFHGKPQPNSTSEASQESRKQSVPQKQCDTEDNGWYTSPNDLIISIISASVDPIQLIQAFTAPRKYAPVPIPDPCHHNEKKGIRERIASISNTLTSGMNNLSISPDSDENWGEYCDSDDSDISVDYDCQSESSPSSSSHRASQSSEANVSTPQCPLPPSHSSPVGRTVSHMEPRQQHLDNVAPHDDAIQFTMSINFNGRKYNATRALPSFVKLRYDLMAELSNLKNHKNIRRRNTGNKQALFNKHNEEHRREPVDDENEPDVIIPELPIGGNKSRSKLEDLEHGAMAMVGMVGSGFRGLQATVCSYKPQMECWIQSVAALVPSSPTLANFLWEPIQNSEDIGRNRMDDNDKNRSAFQSIKKLSPICSQQITRKSSSRFVPSRSLQTLNSIHEASDDESECSSVAQESCENIGCNLSFEDNEE